MELEIPQPRLTSPDRMEKSSYPDMAAALYSFCFCGFREHEDVKITVRPFHAIQGDFSD